MRTLLKLTAFRSSFLFRFFSSAKEEPFSENQWHIAPLKNGAVACWHPKKDVPYECTREVTAEELDKDRKKRKSRYDLPYGGVGPVNPLLREVFHNAGGKALCDFFTSTKTKMIFKALWFGRRQFLEGLAIQEQLFMKIRGSPGKTSYICLLEHSPVYTAGLRHMSYGLEEETRLRNTGADFRRIKRGGLITFHGPGQLVIYPIIDLRSMKVSGKSMGVKRYVGALEQTIIDLCCRGYNMKNVGRTQDPGVWIEGVRKIAAVGVQVRHGITSHGMALNCNVDLSWFDHIVPCGLEGKSTTSLSRELNADVKIDDVLRPLIITLEDIFQSKIHFETVESGNCEKE